MRLPPALLENWMREYYFSAEVDIGSSGVEDFSLAEVRRLTGLTRDEMDAVVFRDSETLGGRRLREALARRWTGGAAERVMVTHGSSEANFLLMHALLGPGDEVVVLDPCYPQLHAVAEALGCRLRQWRLRPENGWVPDLDDLRAALTPRTRMVVVNFPHNPTGATLTRAQLDELIAAVSAVGAWLVWDAAFCDLAHGAAPLPEPSGLYERALSMGTFSKGYGLPGLRVGWCFAAPEVLQRLVRVRDYVTLHLSPLVELVAERAIDHLDRLLAERLPLARANRERVGAWAAAHPGLVEWTAPAGGVCGFPRLPRVRDVEAFCHRLARQDKVLLVPGVCFGHPGHVRLGFGRPADELERGLDRLSRLLRAPRKARRVAAAAGAGGEF